MDCCFKIIADEEYEGFLTKIKVKLQVAVLNWLEERFLLFYLEIICHVATDTSLVASSLTTRQCTYATNDHRLHPCLVPNQSQMNRHRHMILHRSLPHGYSQEKEAWRS